MSAKRYRVQGTDLSHDGKHIPEGGEVVLDDETAADLSHCLVLVDGEATAEKAAAEKAAAEKAAANNQKGGKK